MSLFVHERALATPPLPKPLNGIFGRYALLASVVAVALTVAGGGDAFAKGGTAKPVKGAPSPFTTPTLPDPVFANPTAIHGFDVTGFIQNMTLDPTNVNCPGTTDPGRLGVLSN
ncbi:MULTISPECIES: hypothetical protein [unclassified Pseudomonas]|uniref:hypothetical protein n=1 Tax=unclassified Pseudomonas TaxID=196821 RepID=UPI002115C102|nr:MULTISPECIES: hypothetical protein [unclassified Pseudomonas]